MTDPIVISHAALGSIRVMAFPRLIIIPAAGITATTTIKALPNFCQNSKLKNPFNFSFIAFLLPVPAKLFQEMAKLVLTYPSQSRCRPPRPLDYRHRLVGHGQLGSLQSPSKHLLRSEEHTS